MKTSARALLLLLSAFAAQPAFAFKDGALSLGVGYYSQNFMNRITKSETGKPSFSGETLYPVFLKYDLEFVSDWFAAPQLAYTVISRSSAGDTAKVSFMHFLLPIGTNIGRSSSTIWDWSLGPGLIRYQIKGKGGTKVMNNGTTTATFAVPGRTATIQKVTLNAGIGLTYKRSRFGLDLILENALSSEKRTQSLMVSYAFVFGGRR